MWVCWCGHWARASMSASISTAKRMDIILRAQPWDSGKLAPMPVATGNGSVVPLSELVELRRTVGPDQLVRIDSRRTITLDVYPRMRCRWSTCLRSSKPRSNLA